MLRVLNFVGSAGFINTYLSLPLRQYIHPSLSWLDYWHSTLDGLSDIYFSKVQSVQNSAACRIARAKIVPVLKELHWLPVNQGILVKVLVLTHKASHDLTHPHIKSLLIHYIPFSSSILRHS